MAELIVKGALKSEFNEILTALESKKTKEAISKQEFCECIEILKECVDEQSTTTEAEIRAKILDEAIEKFLEHDCVCVEWNNGLSKEKLVDDVLRQVMGQVVIILEKMKAEQLKGE